MIYTYIELNKGVQVLPRTIYTSLSWKGTVVFFPAWRRGHKAVGGGHFFFWVVRNVGNLWNQSGGPIWQLICFCTCPIFGSSFFFSRLVWVSWIFSLGFWEKLDLYVLLGHLKASFYFFLSERFWFGILWWSVTFNSISLL